MSTEIPSSPFHIRHFNPETDIPRFVQLLTEVENSDHAGEDTSEETVVAQLALPGHDPIQDRWVAVHPERDEQMIGFGTVWKVPQNSYADCYICVHSDWRRHGIGSILLQNVLERAQTLQAKNVLCYADEQHHDVVKFLHKRNFEQVAAYTQMRLAADKQLPQSLWPYGYMTRIYNPAEDFSLLLNMYNRAFQGLWGYWEHVTAEDLQEILAGQKPETIFFVIAQDGEVVGTGRGEINEALSQQRGTRTGYLDASGVVVEHRANDLYVPMLLHAAHLVRDQGNIDIELESWGDDPLVLKQYQEVGFEVVRQLSIYRWYGER